MKLLLGLLAVSVVVAGLYLAFGNTASLSGNPSPAAMEGTTTTTTTNKATTPAATKPKPATSAPSSSGGTAGYSASFDKGEYVVFDKPITISGTASGMESLRVIVRTDTLKFIYPVTVSKGKWSLQLPAAGDAKGLIPVGSYSVQLLDEKDTVLAESKLSAAIVP